MSDRQKIERELLSFFYKGRVIFESVSSLDETKIKMGEPFFVFDGVTGHYQHYLAELNPLYEEGDNPWMKYHLSPGPFFRPMVDARDAIEMLEELSEGDWHPFIGRPEGVWMVMLTKEGKEFVGRHEEMFRAICEAVLGVIRDG